MSALLQGWIASAAHLARSLFGAMLLEDGGAMLLEDGGAMLMENE